MKTAIWWRSALSFPDVSQGPTREDAITKIREAIELCLEIAKASILAIVPRVEVERSHSHHALSRLPLDRIDWPLSDRRGVSMVEFNSTV